MTRNINLSSSMARRSASAALSVWHIGSAIVAHGATAAVAARWRNNGSSINKRRNTTDKHRKRSQQASGSSAACMYGVYIMAGMIRRSLMPYVSSVSGSSSNRKSVALNQAAAA